MKKNYIKQYLLETAAIAGKIDQQKVAEALKILQKIKKDGGGFFFLGGGGPPPHASHAVCDFRKIAGLEAYTAADNVSELTARTNDEGWKTTFVEWLRTSRLGKKDGLLVFSVGGGNEAKKISTNLVAALKYAKKVGSRIIGIVGRDGGYTARVADASIIIPTVNKKNLTAHTESFQAVVWHLLVCHPVLKTGETKWESVR
jgi:D-sedoheptulose 7-phosphate isomerase